MPTSAKSDHLIPRRVALSGGSGLIGTRLRAALTDAGRRVDLLVRRAPRPGTTGIHWDPEKGEIDAQALAGVDAVVHLAGENVGRGRWTTARKAAIRDSRIIGTTLLSQCLAGLDPPPRAFIVASAIGYYGDRGDELLDEDSPRGDGFIAHLCEDWEAAAQPARAAGIRVVNLRLGMILSAAGGALPRMLTPFRYGLGGKLGSGRQYMSWISLTDAVRVIEFAMSTDGVVGPIIVATPNPVTNAEFTKTLGKVLGRPTFCRVPAVAVRLLFGEMGRELLLGSTRAVPKRLEAAGFSFRHTGVEDALRAELGAPDGSSNRL